MARRVMGGVAWGVFTIAAGGLGLETACRAIKSLPSARSSEDVTPLRRVVWVAPAQTTEPSGADSRTAADPQIEEFKKRILDPNSTDEVRSTLAGFLLAKGSTEAFEAAADILKTFSHPVAQGVLCQTVSVLAEQNPQAFLSDQTLPLIPALIELFRHEDETLRRQAIDALSAMHKQAVRDRLLDLVDRETNPTPSETAPRMAVAALNALKGHVHHQPVIERLIRLLDHPDPLIVEAALDALQPACSEPLGGNVEAWKAWWTDQKERFQTEEDWLRRRVDLLMDRERLSERRRQRELEECRRRSETLAARLEALQSEFFFSLAENARDARVLAWLKDPTGTLCESALNLVYSQIGERSTPPSDAVRHALAELLDHPRPRVRQKVVLIFSAIKDRSDNAKLLARLAKEDDLQVHRQLLNALGQLKDPESIPLLRDRIAREDASSGVVAEAARALALIYSDGAQTTPEQTASCLEPLTDRLKRLPPEEKETRSAILEAMAAIGAPEFEGAFLDHVDQEDARILRPVIRGLVRIQSTAKLDRIHFLAGSAPDPLIRQVACEALETLGRTDRDLETLLPRLNPTAEPQISVREAAWKAIRAILTQRPPAQQIVWARRLDETPTLQFELLSDLLAGLSSEQADPAEIEAAQHALGLSALRQQQWAQALQRLAPIHEAMRARRDERTPRIGLDLLQAKLHVAPIEEIIPWVETLLQEDPDSQIFITVMLQTYLESAAPERGRELLQGLQPLNLEGLPPPPPPPSEAPSDKPG